MHTLSEWVKTTQAELRANGVITRLVPPGRKKTYWTCEVFRNGVVYCTATGDTSDEALSKAVATFMADRLSGLGSVN